MPLLELSAKFGKTKSITILQKEHKHLSKSKWGVSSAISLKQQSMGGHDTPLTDSLS